MGFLDFFRPKNPTRDWQRSSGLRLTFDFDACTLNGVGFGAPLQNVSFLGPAEDRSNQHYGEYGYYSLGLVVGSHSDENTLDCFELVNKDADSPQYVAFAGECRSQGASIRLDRMTEAFLRDRFGPPASKDEDEDERILFYEFPGVEWQVELALDGTVNRVVITNNPNIAANPLRPL